jgi:ElaB/YqjD/DUF883 family membrane-anchored ribosome-binding protein
MAITNHRSFNMATNPSTVSKLERPSEAGEDVREQLSALRSDIAGLTSALGDYVKEQKRAVQSRASAGLEALKDAGKSGLKVGGEKALEVKAGAETMIRDNPAGAVAISAGIGFVLGLLTRRR